MTKGKLRFKKRAFAAFMSVAMAAAYAPAIPAFAETTDEIADAKKDEGYHLVWHDEFDGNTLNTKDWNVELHEPGWVNAELQRYTKLEEGNIEVSDGALHIYPKAEKKEKAEGIVDVFDGNGIDGSWIGGGASVSEGKATINVTSVGNDPWDVQFQKAGLTLTQGHEYKFTVKAKAAEERMIALNVGQSYDPWGSFGSNEFTIGTEETECSIEFTMGECLDEGVAAQVNLGNFKSFGDDKSALTTVELWDATLIDLTASSSSAAVFDEFDDSWVGSGSSVNDGVATINVTSVGNDPWDVQFQKAGLTLTEGHEYEFKLTASADEERMIALNVGQSYEPWGSFGSNEFTIGPEAKECSITFTMGECLDGGAAAQVNLGNFKSFGDNLSALTTVTLTDVSLVDLTAQAEGGDEENPKTDYTYTSGRVNTQNKHDFTYGYFEARARVPEGQGYLPAFWLMATDEGNYGQWPKCGEVDIMEVKGQDTSLSYHTIHYGYDVATHKENQVKNQLEESEDDFYDDYHIFAVDWEPDSITWYVDGEEIGSTSDWHTGTDENHKVTYPAPFDQNFYIILNLAVGGSWVGYPDMDVVEDMENQSYDIDYVRVYQKDWKEYEKLEAEAEEPEHESSFREPDEDGNYVVNGKFTEELKEMDSKDDNWELHLESDAKDTTYTRSEDTITISPSAEGAYDYSSQLKQGGVPMIKGWEYELTFDAWADEARTMYVEVEGPNNNWVRYFADKDDPSKDTQVALTTTRTTYTYNFTMEKKTDDYGSLEFNLGNQGSAAPVHIANVSLKHVGGEEIIDEFQKEVTADGNYVLNGSFDQGENRLGYWEVIGDEDKVSVTNTMTAAERKRDLRVKIVAPDKTSDANPIVVYQDELAPIAKGTYEFSFDAYRVYGAANGLIAEVAGKNYRPELTTKKQTFTYIVNNKKSLDRNDSGVAFIITKPGTYYLDNVVLRESAMIKNGSFNSALAGYEYGAYAPGDATFGVDSQKAGNDTAFDADIKDTGDADWNIQLKQRGVKLEKGKSYKLTYKAKATVDRKISVVFQRDGAKDDLWTVYSGDNVNELTKDWQDFELSFTMNDDTDEDALLSVSLGAFDGNRITDVHHVYMDDFVLTEEGGSGSAVAESPYWTYNREKGWKYYKDGKAVKGLQEIDGCIYYFNGKGYAETDAFRKNMYFEPLSGEWDGNTHITGWTKTITGWKYGIGSKLYLKNTWKMIDGKWYYFKKSGVMASNEFVKGWWINKNGTQTDTTKYSWHKTSKGWWYGAKNWYAKSGSYVIDGVKYTFDKNGYCQE